MFGAEAAGSKSVFADARLFIHLTKMILGLGGGGLCPRMVSRWWVDFILGVVWLFMSGAEATASYWVFIVLWYYSLFIIHYSLFIIHFSLSCSGLKPPVPKSSLGLKSPVPRVFYCGEIIYICLAEVILGLGGGGLCPRMIGRLCFVGWGFGAEAADSWSVFLCCLRLRLWFLGSVVCFWFYLYLV